MFALVLVLAAGMAAGSGPEDVSAEAYQGLDLYGGWKGTFLDDQGETREISMYVPRHGRFPHCLACHDDGPGAIRGKFFGVQSLGIFRRDGDRLLLCFREAGKGRPATFQGGNGQNLIILHRVKPTK